MKSSIHIDQTELATAYGAGESASSIARRHGVSVWAIITRLHKLGLTVRSSKTQNERLLGPPKGGVGFSFRELIDGLLLGDGQIDPKGILHLQQSLVREGWVLQVQQHLQALGGEARILPSKARVHVIEGRDVFEKEGRHLYTPAYIEMQAERLRWYPKKLKVIPRDCRLTPFVVAHWFAGDGTGDSNGSLVFYTNGFVREEVSFLIERLLLDLGVSATLDATKRVGQFKVGVHRKAEAFKLKELIKPYLPSCCEYKLRFVYSSEKQKHFLAAQILEIRKRFRAGETVSELARCFEAKPVTIQKILCDRSYRSVEDN